MMRTAILEFIDSHIKKKGYAPTVREIAKAVGLQSSSTVHGHLERLEKQGLITREKNSPRTIRIVESTEGKEEINDGTL